MHTFWSVPRKSLQIHSFWILYPWDPHHCNFCGFLAFISVTTKISKEWLRKITVFFQVQNFTFSIIFNLIAGMVNIFVENVDIRLKTKWVENHVFSRYCLVCNSGISKINFNFFYYSYVIYQCNLCGAVTPDVCLKKQRKSLGQESFRVTIFLKIHFLLTCWFWLETSTNWDIYFVKSSVPSPIFRYYI